jgi:hypothetical protein
LRLPCGPPLQLVGLCHVRDDVLHMLLGILLGQAGATPNQLRQISPITRTQIPVGDAMGQYSACLSGTDCIPRCSDQPKIVADPSLPAKAVP